MPTRAMWGRDKLDYLPVRFRDQGLRKWGGCPWDSEYCVLQPPFSPRTDSMFTLTHPCQQCGQSPARSWTPKGVGVVQVTYRGRK